MGLRVPDKIDSEDVVSTLNPPKVKVAHIQTRSAVETMNGFQLRRVNPLELTSKEKDILWVRFYRELDTFAIYFLDDAIDERFGFPIHLKNICKQLISYHQYNLIIAPRGFSKSTTISCAFPLREIVYRQKRYIVIVSETMDIAGDFTETIRHELETNAKLKLFYGDFKSKRDQEDSTEKWTVSDLVCRSNWNNRWFYTRVRARGCQQQIRGKKYRHQRPDLLIFDDMESRLNTFTEDQRIKIKKWFNRDALKVISDFDTETGQGQVIVAGTIVHPESRLNRLKIQNDQKIDRGEEAIWKIQFYKAADNPKTLDNPIWPERKGKEFLERERQIAEENDDLAGFVQELFNEPIAEDERKFKPIHFMKRYQSVRIENYYGILVLIEGNERYPCKLSAGLDIGGSKDDKSDYTGIIIGAVAYDRVNDISQGYVLEAYNEKWDYDEIIDNMFDISERFSFVDNYRSKSLYNLPWTVETNAYQDAIYHFLMKESRRRKKFIYIAHEEHESMRKESRILSLLPVFRSGFWKFREDLQWLVQRFLDYGIASDMHDDVEDAFEKMHRNALIPTINDYEMLNKISPTTVEPVEPENNEFQGNFLTL